MPAKVPLTAQPGRSLPYGPMSVATSFHGAPAAADGVTAAALVVPEERKGCFHAQAIRAFYIVMSIPLKSNAHSFREGRASEPQNVAPTAHH